MMFNFQHVPPDSRVPFVYVEFDNSKILSSSLNQTYKVLLLGNRPEEIGKENKGTKKEAKKGAAGDPPTDELTKPELSDKQLQAGLEIPEPTIRRIYSETDAIKFYGFESEPHLMARAFFRNNASTELYCFRPAIGGEITDVIPYLKDDHYNFIACSHKDVSQLKIFDEELERRFLPNRSLESVLISAIPGTSSSELAEVYKDFRSKFNVILATYDSKDSPSVWAAAVAGIVALHGNQDQGLPFGSLPIEGVKPPSKNFDFDERDTLLKTGLSTFKIDSFGKVRIESLVTTYKNKDLPDDRSYSSLNTLLMLSYMRFSFRSYFANKYPRAKLASDELAPKMRTDSPIITPTLAKAEALSVFRTWEAKGFVDNFEEFKNDLRVNIDSTKGRVEFKLSPRLVGQLTVIAAKINFTI